MAVVRPTGAFVGKVKDLTGPGITDHLGVTSTDLGATVRAADGHLVSVFGDTFSGRFVIGVRRVGEGKYVPALRLPLK